MARRDRKAADEAAKAVDDDATDTTADDSVTEKVAAKAISTKKAAAESDDDSAELRPSGKRSARGKRGAEAPAKSAGAVAVKDRDGGEATKSANPFVRVWLFLRQVIGELRKVIWPTRREMIVYSIAVLVFVAAVTAAISGMDIGFAKLALTVFGSDG